MTGYSAQGIVLVKRKPDTASEEVLRQQVTLIAKDGAKALTTSDLPGLISSLTEAGIVVDKDNITLVAKQTKVQDKDGNAIAVFNDDGSLNANLINAKQIVADGLKANTFDAGNATINNLIVNNAQVTGKITATSGSIGAFNLNSDGTLTVGNADNNGRRNFGLAENAIYFTHKTGTTIDSIMWLGRTEQYIGGEEGTANLWIEEKETSPTHSKACLYLTAKGYTGNETGTFKELRGNFAIYAVEGMYAGFRPAIRTISNNMALTQMDCVLLCTNSQSITLTLPNAPLKGQMYYIFQYGNSITIKSPNSNYKIWGRTAENVTQFISNQHLQGSIVIFSGEKWIINYMNG